jgi:hypothetical protein
MLSEIVAGSSWNMQTVGSKRHFVARWMRKEFIQIQLHAANTEPRDQRPLVAYTFSNSALSTSHGTAYAAYSK